MNMNVIGRLAHSMAAAAGLGLINASALARDGCIPAPTNFYAADQTHCNPVDMGWESNGGTAFRVMRAPADNPGAAEALDTVDTTSYYDYSAEPGRVYLYWVIAIAACGESDPSEMDTGGSGLGGIAPPAWIYASDNQYCDLIVVDWDQGNGGYWDIYRGDSPDFASAFLLESLVYPPYNDYGVAGNVAYYYWIVPNTGCGTGGNPSPGDVGYSNYGLYINSDPGDAYAYEGDSASFSVGISGFGAFQWFRDGEMLFDDGRISGANSDSLNIYPVYTSDEANYWCEVYGGCGSVTSGSAHLYVEAAPCLPPSWVTASDNEYCDLIVVDWDTGSGAFSYDVYRSETQDFAAATLVANSTFPAYYDYGVSGNVGYYYWVVANLSCGNSPPSEPDIGYSNFGLYITGDPTDEYVTEGEAASFTVEISGFGSFQWFRDGDMLSDGDGYSGVTGPMLTIDPAALSHEGDYYCEVYGGCGTQTSGSAHLYVEERACPADFNQDGGIDGADVEAFFRAWEAGEAGADVNGDGGIDGSDVATFFAAWEAGGCD